MSFMSGVGPVELLLVLVVVAALVALLWPRSRTVHVSDEAFVPHLSAEAVDSALLRELSALDRWKHVRAHGRVHVVERSYTQGVAVAVAILAFPIGLLALLWRGQYRAEVSVADAHGGCRVRFVTTAPRAEVELIAQAIQRAAPSVNVLL